MSWKKARLTKQFDNSAEVNGVTAQTYGETMCVRVYTVWTHGVAKWKGYTKLTTDWLTPKAENVNFYAHCPWILGHRLHHSSDKTNNSMDFSFDRTTSILFRSTWGWFFSSFFFWCLPNVYTNVLGSQKENSIQSYRRIVVPHTFS